MARILAAYALAMTVWLVSTNECPPFKSDTMAETCSFRENGLMLNIPVANCSQYLDTHCCFDGSICYNKQVSTVDSSPEDEEVDFEEDVFSIPVANNSGNKRTILGGLCPPTTPTEFPDNCKFVKGEFIPYVYEPPVDVPYCSRIPCSTDDVLQGKLEKSLRECGIRPGCYFDRELAALRKKHPLFILPGVPVCHLAIRSSVFQIHALKVIIKHGSWNPYFTNCLLENYEKEIENEPAGCKMLSFLKIFKIAPKKAGWKGITPSECRLIEGCWRTGLGCFYPADINRVKVKSGQMLAKNPFESRYGRDKCQEFNDANPYEILKSIHKCLSSGCSLDPEYEAAYYSLMFQLGEKMPNLNDHWVYWDGVLKGDITSKSVFDGIPFKWNNDFKGDFELSSLKPTEPPPQLNFLSPLQQQQLCSADRRFLGLRPCPPKWEAPSKMTSPCPYKRIPLYKDLKGSFEGCCDINPCHLSRHDVRHMFSGPSHYYTAWSEFEPCNGPVAKRTRTCIAVEKEMCTEEVEDVKNCGTWGNWGSWSPCIRRCTRIERKRECSTGNVNDCPGGENASRERQNFCRCFG